MRTDRRPTVRVVIAAALVVMIVLALVAGGLLYGRGGIGPPAERARAEAEAGYAARIDPLEKEESQRRVALGAAVGEPIGQTWYVICGAVEPGFLIPASQFCDLSVVTTYAMPWDDPPARLDEVLTALESTDLVAGMEEADAAAGWQRTDRAALQEPVGKVAEVEDGDGSVYVREPGTEVILSDQPVPGPFPDRALRREAIPETVPGPREAAIEVRRRVHISRTNIGCVLDRGLACRTPLGEPSMPAIEGYRE